MIDTCPRPEKPPLSALSRYPPSEPADSAIHTASLLCFDGFVNFLDAALALVRASSGHSRLPLTMRIEDPHLSPGFRLLASEGPDPWAVSR